MLAHVTWRDSTEARLECFSPLFRKNTEIHILTMNEETISERSIKNIDDFLALSDVDLEKMRQFLFEDCKFNCENSSYGFDVPEGADEAKINHEEFGVLNGHNALEKSTMKYLLISEHDQESYTNNYGRLQFDNEWNSHLTTIVMKNGTVVGYGDSGLNLGQWEQ